MLLTDLPAQIKHAISCECKASQRGYASDLGMDAGQLSRIINRKFPNESTMRLLDIMGYDLSINIQPSKALIGNRISRELSLRFARDPDPTHVEQITKEVFEEFGFEYEAGDSNEVQ